MKTSAPDLVGTGGIIEPLMSITGKRVLVTGALGFIGSHLSSELAKAGCDVLGVDIASRGTWLVDSRHSLLEANGVRTAKLDVRRGSMLPIASQISILKWLSTSRLWQALGNHSKTRVTTLK